MSFENRSLIRLAFNQPAFKVAMNWDATTIVAVTTAVNATIAAAIAGLMKLRKSNSDLTIEQKKQNIEVQRQVIEQLTSRVEALESKLDKKEDDHRECERKLGMLEGRIEQLSKEMDKAFQRHDTKTWEQTLSMKDEAIKELNRRLAELEEKKH
jgi:predicted RNase H-like nuclease (RuvC/YqgF family)